VARRPTRGGRQGARDRAQDQEPAPSVGGLVAKGHHGRRRRPLLARRHGGRLGQRHGQGPSRMAKRAPTWRRAAPKPNSAPNCC
jgi:hypothetical protein